ncbi:MAG: ATP-binding protein [Crocinitomicaceae bacterium]
MNNTVQNIILLVLAAILTVVVFAIDFNASDNISTGVAYTIVIFYSWIIPWKNTTIYAGLLCTVLIIISSIYGNSEQVATEVKILNIVFSLMAIWICALLVKTARRSFDFIANSKEELEVLVDKRTLELKNSQQLLKESELVYRYLYEQANEMHFSLDLKTMNIIQCNQTLATRINKDKSELLNKDTSSIFTSTSNELILDKITSESPEIIKDFRVQLKTANNDFIDALLNASLVMDEEGSAYYYRVSLTDISKQLNTAQRLTKQNEQLLEKNKELEQFAYIASHDLQEPLRTITSFIGLIGEKYSIHFDEEGKSYMDRIHVANLRMKKLILGLLDYSRLGKNSEESKINMNAFFQGILDDFQLSIEEKNAKIKLGNIPSIIGRPDELRLLFQNLISNALKFTEQDCSPEIEIGAIKTNEEVKIFVKDNGIGIEEIFQQRIFLIFQRLHSREEYEGTGIGLAQVDKIATLHEGKIELESELGKGSIFTLTLPISRLG